MYVQSCIDLLMNPNTSFVGHKMKLQGKWSLHQVWIIYKFSTLFKITEYTSTFEI